MFSLIGPLVIVSSHEDIKVNLDFFNRCVEFFPEDEACVYFSTAEELIDKTEFYLKNKIDRSINVWCEPIGDKNSLRNLRGIQIKS